MIFVGFGRIRRADGPVSSRFPFNPKRKRRSCSIPHRSSHPETRSAWKRRFKGALWTRCQALLPSVRLAFRGLVWSLLNDKLLAKA
jgi:hypothetical protein